MNAQRARYVVEVEGTAHEVAVGADGSAAIGGRRHAVSLVEVGWKGGWSLLLDGVSVPLVARCDGGGKWGVEMEGRTVAIRVLEAREAEIRRRAAGASGSTGIAPLEAPMPGLVVRVAAREGDVVQPGTAILIVEAMKMENEMRAAAAARIGRILVSEGDAVEKGQVLAEFEEVETP
ncbi:MAG: biotin/lipoyl-binding protein [Gemmatimonadota bacterium]|nr:biotin/lipoyl-binding protein [Gemmatimonadota bacterium]